MKIIQASSQSHCVALYVCTPTGVIAPSGILVENPGMPNEKKTAGALTPVIVVMYDPDVNFIRNMADMLTMKEGGTPVLLVDQKEGKIGFILEGQER
jgi:hypothetical protein